MKKIVLSILVAGILVGANAGSLQERYEENCKYFNIQPTKMTDAELKTLVPKMEDKRTKAEEDKITKLINLLDDKSTDIMAFALKNLDLLNSKATTIDKNEFGNTAKKDTILVTNLLKKMVNNKELYTAYLFSMIRNNKYETHRWIVNPCQLQARCLSIFSTTRAQSITPKSASFSQDELDFLGKTLKISLEPANIYRTFVVYLTPDDEDTAQRRNLLLTAFLILNSKQGLIGGGDVRVADAAYLSLIEEKNPLIIKFFTQLSTEGSKAATDYLLRLPEVKKSYDIIGNLTGKDEIK